MTLQADILEEGMILHGSRVSAALKPFHENLEKRFKEMKTKTAHFKKVGGVLCRRLYLFNDRKRTRKN